MNNIDLKATNSYFDQIAQTSRRLARTEYSNIDKLHTSLQLTKKYFDQVEQKSKRLSNIYYTNIDSLNEKLQQTEKRLGNIKNLAKNLSSLNIDVQLTISSKVTSALDGLIKKIATPPSKKTSSPIEKPSSPSNKPSSSSEKSPEEKAIIAANYQKSNDDVYNARMNAKKAGFDRFKAPLDAIKAPFDLLKAPTDLFNSGFKTFENVIAAKKMIDDKRNKISDAKKPKTDETDKAQEKETTKRVSKNKQSSREKVSKNSNRANQAATRPIVKCYPKVTVNCYCDGGSSSGRNSKKKGRSGKSKGSSRSSSSSKSTRKGFSSKPQTYSPEAKAKNVSSKMQSASNTRTPTPSSQTKSSRLGGKGPRLGIVGGAGLLSLGGTNVGDMASNLTDKLAGSKSGMLKGVGKGLLSGGSKLFAPLAIAASVARVATAKPEERSGAIGSAIGGTAGAAIGGAIGSIIPVFGTTLGMMAGGMVGSALGGKLGESKIAKDALNTVSQGITGTFDYLADKTKNIKEGFMSFFGGKEKAPETPPAQKAINQVNPMLSNQATSLAATPTVNSVIANNTNPQSVAAQTANGKTNATGKMQQVQIDAAQMNMISGYLTDFKAQVTNAVSVNVPAGAVQVTVQENEIDYDALVLQIGQRVVNELRKSMQNRKSDSPGNTSAKPIMA